jgi:hypothetical protein
MRVTVEGALRSRHARIAPFQNRLRGPLPRFDAAFDLLFADGFE